LREAGADFGPGAAGGEEFLEVSPCGAIVAAVTECHGDLEAGFVLGDDVRVARRAEMQERHGVMLS